MATTTTTTPKVTAAAAPTPYVPTDEDKAKLGDISTASAVDPVSLAQFNDAVALAIRSLRDCANYIQQAQLARTVVADFTTTTDAMMADADTALTTIGTLLGTIVPDPPLTA